MVRGQRQKDTFKYFRRGSRGSGLAKLCVSECITRALVAYYTPLISVSLKHGAIFTQQLTHLFHTHKHTGSATQGDKGKHAHTHTRGKKLQIVSCLRPPHHYTTMHHEQEVQMVGVLKTQENRQIVVHTSSIQPHGGCGGVGGPAFF